MFRRLKIEIPVARPYQQAFDDQTNREKNEKYHTIHIYHAIIKQSKKKKEEKNRCHLNPIQMNRDRIRERRWATVT